MNCVSLSEFRKHQGHYLSACANENIYLTKRGKVVAVLVNPQDQAYAEFFLFAESVKDREPNKSYGDALFEEREKRHGRN